MLKAEPRWNTEGIDIRYERKSQSRPSESFDLTCIWAYKNDSPVDILYIFLKNFICYITFAHHGSPENELPTKGDTWSDLQV